MGFCFPSVKPSSAGKVQYLRYAQMLGHVFFLGEKNCTHWLVMLIFKLVDVPKPRMAIMGKDLELSPGYCTSISVVSHEVVMIRCWNWRTVCNVLISYSRASKHVYKVFKKSSCMSSGHFQKCPIFF